jgi:aspartyl-tRNA synthetase
VAKNLSEPSDCRSGSHVGAAPGDCVFFAAGATRPSRALLGAVRLEIAKRCGAHRTRAWSHLWVLDAPLFEPAGEAVAAGDVAVGAGAWTAVHHAFTSPKAEFLDTFDTDPGPALAYAYDMVCNGNEIGGGSIRIHRRDIQERVFRVMGLSRGGGAGEVPLPARRLRSSAPPRTAASPSGGTGSSPCSSAPSRSATSSPSRSPAAATTR